MNCKKCGAFVPDGSVYCGECGAPVTMAQINSQPRYCDACETLVEAGMDRCPVCGRAVADMKVVNLSKKDGRQQGQNGGRQGVKINLGGGNNQNNGGRTNPPPPPPPPVNPPPRTGGGPASGGGASGYPPYSRDEGVPVKAKNNTVTIIILVVVIALLVIAAGLLFIFHDKIFGTSDSSDSTPAPTTASEVVPTDGSAQGGSDVPPTIAPATGDASQTPYVPTPTPQIQTVPPTVAPVQPPQSGNSVINMNAGVNEYIFAADSRYVEESDLYGLSQSEVRLLINEMYARHGYIFKSAEYADYFSRKTWYVPLYTDQAQAESMFNSIERENKNRLVRYEQSRGWR